MKAQTFAPLASSAAQNRSYQAFPRTQTALLLLLTLLTGCAATTPNDYPPRDDAVASSIYVVTQGWHTGIVLRRADIPAAAMPESADFAQATYLMVGWGDRDYYPAAEFSVWYGLKALFWPTASVIHLVGFNAPPQERFPDEEVVELAVTRAGLAQLSATIGASFDRHGARAARLVRDPAGAGWFYPSRERFHLFKTCNVWVARALETAGVPVSSFLSLTTGSVMAQIRRFDRRIRAAGSARSCRVTNAG